MVVSSFAIGVLSIPVFDLGFVDSILAILFFNCLAITPVAFFSSFGPRFGLRQMVLSRYFFGFHGVKISKWLRAFRENEAFSSQPPTPPPFRGVPLPQSPFLPIGDQELTSLRSCVLQRPRLCGVVRRKCHSWRPTNQCRQHERSWLCWHHHNRGGDMARHRLRLQSCARLRVLVVDPQPDHLPHHTRRIRAQW